MPQIKTMLVFEDSNLNRVFGAMQSTKENRATVRSLYREARYSGFDRTEAKLLGAGAAFAYGFWTGENFQ